MHWTKRWAAFKPRNLQFLMLLWDRILWREEQGSTNWSILPSWMGKHGVSWEKCRALESVSSFAPWMRWLIYTWELLIKDVIIIRGSFIYEQPLNNSLQREGKKFKSHLRFSPNDCSVIPSSWSQAYKWFGRQAHHSYSGVHWPHIEWNINTNKNKNTDTNANASTNAMPVQVMTKCSFKAM